MAGLLNIGLTGLMAAQGQLNTTSHNITNAATAGYTRQRVIQTTNDPVFTGVGFFGQGTRIAAVTRQYSQYLEAQVLAADNRRAEYAAYSTQITQINNLLADPTAGLSPALEAFFAGVQEVAANPTSIPARQALISAGEAFVARFQALDARLTEIRDGVEGQIGSTVESINTLARQIAELNQRIVIAQAAGPTVPANDLLDQRDVLVSELNKLVKTSTVIERDGQMSVFIGSGQALVLGQNVSQLGVVPSNDDVTRNNIALIAPNGVAVQLPERLLNGGELGGLLAFRRESLDASRDQLNRIARQFAEIFNQQHALGVDLDGVLGGDFFKLDMVWSDGGNPATLPVVEIANDNLLTNDRYRVVYDSGAPGGFVMTRLSDGATIDPADVGLSISPPPSPPAPAPVDGDAYLVVPLRNAARDIAMAIRDPRDVAVGSPVSVSANLTNGGTGAVENIRMLSVDGFANAFPQFTAFEMTFDAATNELVVASPDFLIEPSPATYDPTTDSSGKQFTITDAAGNPVFTFTMAGAPADGARFTFGPTELGVADNRNAVALGALQTSKTMLVDSAGNPTATFQSAYSQLVTLVGNKGREVEVGLQVQETLLRQATDSREALSGVNLDEEAANLLRYQQAYQAAGRVMSIAQRLFDEIVSIGR
ncbi:MAG: flagellar hook-associated protein FlgK [Rhodocyclaceae bacterium]